MTPEQENICRANFHSSMIASGHGDELEQVDQGQYYLGATQFRWLGYKRCWEEQVLPTAVTVGTASAPDYTPPSPSETECVFVGGPLHGLHIQDTSKEYRLTEHAGTQYCYSRRTTESGHIYYVTYDSPSDIFCNSPQTVG